MSAEIKTRAIVVKSAPYGESDLIVTFLTEGHGLVKGFAKGALRSRKRFAGCFEPFTLVQLAMRPPRSGSLFRVVSADILYPFHGMRDNLERIEAGAVVLELVAGAGPHGPDAEASFDLLENTLSLMEKSPGANALCAVYFVKHLTVSGYRIPFAACSDCGGRLTGKGAVYAGGHGLLCTSCGRDKGGAGLTPGALAFIRRSEQIEIIRMGRLRSSKAQLAEIFKFLRVYSASAAGMKIKSFSGKNIASLT